ncbi:hypothetical protein NMY22_g13725 [Coprinellus aureogranulatus]|nr:hypothetical protein NMY22_g13725 [Coprinellus aureogranulatus]
MNEKRPPAPSRSVTVAADINRSWEPGNMGLCLCCLFSHYYDHALAMFEAASNFTVGDISQVNSKTYHYQGKTIMKDVGHYTNNIEINAGVYHHHGSCTVDPLKELYDHIAVGAMHNSNDRADAPKCHPQTRKAVQEDIFSWVTRDDVKERRTEADPVAYRTSWNGQDSDYGNCIGDIGRERAVGRLFLLRVVHQLGGKNVETVPHTDVSVSATSAPDFEGPHIDLYPDNHQQNPAIFEMCLKDQMEKLVLQHLRQLRGTTQCLSTSPMVIIVDGIDECGEDAPDDPRRSKKKDQVEVLSALLQAAKDPVFPFRIVVASRPESWIRQFFTDTCSGHITEIFLDNRYNADRDIALFLRSKFSELRRRYNLPLTWPDDGVIAKLAENASGQFIYAATVLRFIDSPPFLPHDQLNIVLKINPPSASNPFGALDALYSSILRSSPSAVDTVLWLKAYQRLRCRASQYRRPLPPSAWVADRLFESSPGQARMLLNLPSLIYLQEYVDLPVLGSSTIFAQAYGWNSRYTFYHRSFLDYLEDPTRCGAAFPEVDGMKVERWIWERFSRVLLSHGPQVPTHGALLAIFVHYFFDLFHREAEISNGRMRIDPETFSQSDPAWWLHHIPNPTGDEQPQHVVWKQLFFHIVHQNCRGFLPCHPGCKRWRKGISRLPSKEWRTKGWGPFTLLLDRFCIKRIRL